MKTRTVAIYLVTLLAIFVFVEGEAFAQTQKLTISNIKNDDYGGCGCGFQSLAEAKKRNSTKMVFWSEDEKTAIVNINGRDTTFKLTRRGQRPRVLKVGNRFSDEYASGGIILKIDYTVTHVCRRGDEGCEATSYDVTMTAVRGKTRTVLKTKGACGC